MRQKMRRKRKRGITFVFLFIFIFFWEFPFPPHAQEFTISPTWREALGAKIIGEPTSQASSVVILCDDGTVRCFSQGGKLLWTFDTHSKLLPFVNRAPDGTTYVMTQERFFIALNRAGRKLWNIRLPAFLSSPIRFGWDGRLFVPLGDKILCLTPAGFQLWEQKLPFPLREHLITDTQGGILGITEGGTLIRLSAVGILEHYPCDFSPRVVFALPSMTEGSWKVGIYYDNGKGEILQGGKKEASLPSLSSPPLHATEHQGKLALFLENGNLALINLESYEVLWEEAVPFYQKGGSKKEIPSYRSIIAESRLLFDERGIYYLSRTGAVGFTLAGQRLWQLTLKGASSLPAFSDEGILYAGGTDWILYAYKIEERVKSRVPSLYGPFPEGSYGFGSPSGGFYFMYSFDTEEAALQTKLTEIQGAIQNKAIGEKEKAYYEILCFIAEGKVPPGWQPIPLSYRLQALKMLGTFASRELIPFLARLVHKESESLVIAQALTALGDIGSDPFGEAMGSFRYLLTRPFLYQNERLATSLARAIYQLCMFSGPPLSVEGVHLLVQLSSQNFSVGLQNTIKTYLADLRKES